MPTDLAPAIYGTIAVGALLAAESPRRETFARTVGAVVITLMLYWLAHAYAHFAGRRLRERGEMRLADFRQELTGDAPLLLGAAIPLVPLVLWWIAGGSLSGAVLAAVITSAVMLVALELVAGIRAKASGRALAVQTAFGAALGLMILALRVLLH